MHISGKIATLCLSPALHEDTREVGEKNVVNSWGTSSSYKLCESKLLTSYIKRKLKLIYINHEVYMYNSNNHNHGSNE